LGDKYARLIAKTGSPDHADPTSTQRTLGDLIDPTRSGGIMPMVNSVSREVGRDVADWSIRRIWSLYAQMEAEARERERQHADL
jgi:hypothetical protein